MPKGSLNKMGELLKLSLFQAKEGLKKEFSSLELTIDCLNEIKKSNSLNAFIEITEKHAIAKANEADKKLVKNEHLNLLGIPIGVKDIFVMKALKHKQHLKF